MEQLKTKQILIAIMLILIGYSFSIKKNNKKLIIGNWEGTTDDVSAFLSFDKLNRGSIKYSTLAQVRSFRYYFKNDSVIEISNGKLKSLHCISLLNKDKLRLRPYPIKKDSESIDIINLIDFTRKR